MEDHALKPPYSNTGAERTKKERLHATVDWVSVTFTCDKFHEVFTQILKMPEEQFIFYDKGLQQLKKIKTEMDLKYLEELYQAKEITERNDQAIDLNQNPYYEDIDFDYYQNWNRYEIVCKQENAQEVAYHFATGLLADSLLLSIMNDYMRVTTPNAHDGKHGVLGHN